MCRTRSLVKADQNNFSFNQSAVNKALWHHIFVSCYKSRLLIENYVKEHDRSDRRSSTD